VCHRNCFARIDMGLRVVLVDDAICSSSDEGHDAILKVFHGRFTHQVDTASAQDVLSGWVSG
jgi:nicotinamidase-related amidase